MTDSSPTLRANGLDLAYETFGNPSDPPMLLIMGLGAQMILWPTELCERLAAGGHYVIRYDNRDVGRSTWLDQLGNPGPVKSFLGRAASYTLDDMAEDAAGVLDALDLSDAHIVGASMGGFIAQTFALAHPERVRSLTLIMTSTGSRRVGTAHPKVFKMFLKRPVVNNADDAARVAVEGHAIIGNPGYPDTDGHLERLAREGYERGYHPAGFARQFAAIGAQPDRTKALGDLDVPTLVMHGLSDPLVAPSGGLALAKAIKGAKFVGYWGMGHSLPSQLWPDVAAEINAIADAGEARQGAAPAPADQVGVTADAVAAAG